MALDIHVMIARKEKKAVAYRHFFDNDFRPQYFWFRQLHFIVLLALNTLQAFLSGVPPHAVYALPLFAGTQIILCVYFITLLWFRPMLHDESWKLPTKLGAIIVSSVGAALNLCATIREPSFVGFAVNDGVARSLFLAANVAFLGATCLLIIMMAASFILLLLFGGDDLLPRVGRVVCVLFAWVCAVLCSVCVQHREEAFDEFDDEVKTEDSSLRFVASPRHSIVAPVAAVAAELPLAWKEDSAESEEEEEEEESDDVASLPGLPRSPAKAVRTRTSIFALASSLRDAVAPRARPSALVRGTSFLSSFEDTISTLPGGEEEEEEEEVGCVGMEARFGGVVRCSRRCLRS
jgi:hypothetical protein